MIVKAPPKGRTLVCHRNGYVTLWDGFFWNYTCLPTKEEMGHLSPKERARVRRHLGWD
jgi:hypothetical protein